MQSMPRPRPPHLHREVTRHGTAVWYVRVGHGPRVRVPAPGSDDFDRAYRSAIAGEAPPSAKPKAKVGSLSWLADRYRETSSWTDLSPATRKQREAILKQILADAGTEQYAEIDRGDVAEGRDRRRDTPAQARHFLDTIRSLFAWAVDAGFVKENPAAGIRAPKQSMKGEGFAVWTQADVIAFEQKHPIGTRARVAFDVLRYTGLRRGDAAQLGRPHVRDGVIALKTEKTGEWVTLRMSKRLAATIAAGPCGELTYIAGERGLPLTKETFGNQFREWCREAGVDKSAHGLRKLAATTMAENGATVSELEAVFGWKGGRMASHYTRSANRKALGLASSSLIEGTRDEQSIPAPRGKVRESRQKTQ